MELAGEVNTVKLSRKIVDIASGEAHNLIVTGDGRVFCWGKGFFGRLGLGSDKDEFSPVQVKFGNPKNGDGDSVKIVGVAAGAYHSLALSEDGGVWSWGYNLYGQLGISGEESNDEENFMVGNFSLVPKLLNKFLELDLPDSSTGVSEAEGKASLKICAVKAGGMMSLAIDNHRTLWMWGNYPQQNKEGGFSLVSSSVPTPVQDFHGRTVVKVACGNEHIVALVSPGESYNGEDLVCYSWGSNGHGQLGLGDKENRPCPEVVKISDEESSWTVYEVACGASHTALLARRKNPDDTLESVCWTFGLGDNGQLGHGTTQSALFPTPVKELPENVHLFSVDCGLFHTSVVSSAGDVWSWGMERGLGLFPEAVHTADSGDALLPRLISHKPNQPKFPDPVKISCGAAHTVILAQKGYKMWSWGRGRNGVLGNGKGADCYIPTLVLWPPTTEGFEEEELDSSDEQDKVSEKETKVDIEADELKQLQTKLSIMEKYAGMLHGSIFGKPFDERDIPASLQNSGSLDFAKEWKNMLETADHLRLMRLEMFYRDLLAGVKDKIMERRIKQIVKECLQSSETKY